METSKRSTRAVLKAVAAVMLAAVMLVALGCGGGDAGEDGGETQTSADTGQDGTIKFHANAELSGPGSAFGVARVAAAKVATERINEDGGIHVGDKTYQLEMIECDNRTDPTYGVQCAQQAVDEGALWTMAPDLGFEAAYQIFKENNIITVGNGGDASNFLTESPEEHPLLTFELLTFQVEYGESQLIQLKSLYPDAKRVATLLPNDANGKVVSKAMQERAPKLGLEIVASEFHATDATGDFSSALTKLKAAKPDAIYLGYYPQVVAAALEQGRDLQAADIFMAAGVTLNDLEGTNFEGVDFISFQFAYSWFPGFMPDDPEWLDTIARIEEAVDGQEYLPSIAVVGFIGDVYMLKNAIEAAGTLDPEAVVAKIPGLGYEGPFGPAEGTENRATDTARTPFVVHADGRVSAYTFDSGFATEPSAEVEVPEANMPWAD